VKHDHIRDYWELQGEKHGASHWASWGDNWMIDLEIETIAEFINDGDKVLDVGCANGFGVFRQAESHQRLSIMGVDFAAKMIDAAQKVKQEKSLGADVEFREGDVRSLEFPDNVFDLVYTTRVLINLPTWELQVQGIAECVRVVKPGGTVVLSEGFWEPLIRLNAIRAICHLPALVEHDFNRYLKMSVLERHLCELGYPYEINDFSSIYYLGSRLLREMVTDPHDYPGFSNPINKMFFEIERQFSGGGFGIQQAVVIRKPAAIG